jgi:hypothetical protein
MGKSAVTGASGSGMTIEEGKYNIILYLIQVYVSTYIRTYIHKVVSIMPILYWTSLLLNFFLYYIFDPCSSSGIVCISYFFLLCLRDWVYVIYVGHIDKIMKPFSML